MATIRIPGDGLRRQGLIARVLGASEVTATVEPSGDGYLLVTVDDDLEEAALSALRDAGAA